MLQIRKQDITTLDLSPLKDFDQTQLDTWCETHKLDRFSAWLLPQLLAQIGSWTLVRDASGKLDPLQTLKQNCVDPQQRGYWQLTRAKRSLLVKNQVREPEYSTLTPLILLAFRRMQGVPYSAWTGCDNLKWIIEPRILSSVCLTPEQAEIVGSLGSERLLELRQQGLTTRSSSKESTSKSAETTWKLYHLDGTEIGGLPTLTQTIITQCWLAHPKNRRDTMILDPLNWDNMPPPLVSNEIFKQPTPQPPAKPAKISDAEDLSRLPF